jgi:hypothetical protein
VRGSHSATRTARRNLHSILVDNVVKKSRKIVTHFKHSEQACRYLTEFQHTCDIPQHKLKQDVETRWNSTFLMLERLAEQRKALNLYSVERGNIDTLSASEWELIDRIVRVLKPFYDATLELCGDDSCLSLVIPIITLLNAKLQTTTEDVGLMQMKAALRDAMFRRFGFIKTNRNLIAATLLDPRFKDIYFSSQEKADAVTVIVNFLRRATDDNAAPAVDSQPPSATVALTSSVESSLWDDYDNYVLSLDSAETSPASSQLTVETQLNNYLRDSRVPRSTNIYGYWNTSQFPALEPAARKFLSAPPTSVASEQLFSAAGQIYADRRSNLLGDNVDKLLFLSYNIRLFDFVY